MITDPQRVQLSSSDSSKLETWRVRAVLLGNRIDTKGFEQTGAIASAPLTLQMGGGTVFLFRYGAAVFGGVPLEAERKLLTDLRPRVVDPLNSIESEQAVINVQSDIDEHVELVRRDRVARSLAGTAASCYPKASCLPTTKRKSRVYLIASNR